MLVTDRLATRGRDLVDVVEAAVAGGVGLVQVRERDLPEAESRPLCSGGSSAGLRGRRARGSSSMAAPRWPARSASGLHLPAAAPPAVPVSAFTVSDGRPRRGRGPAGAAPRVSSYVVVGSGLPDGIEARPSGRGARDCSPGWPGSSRPTPVFAIGGLAPGPGGGGAGAGAHGVAVRSAILGAAEPARAARAFAEALTERATA